MVVVLPQRCSKVGPLVVFLRHAPWMPAASVKVA
jgi:hypothetical protein